MVRKSKYTKDDMQKLLINSAKAVVCEEGVKGLTARAVASQAGYSVGTIYNAFENLDELILYINAETLTALREEFSEVISNERGNQPLGRMVGKFYIDFAKRHLPFWNLLFEHQAPEGERYPEWYQKIINSVFEVLQELLSPYLPKEVSVSHQASRVLWASCHGILMLSLSGRLNVTDAGEPEALCESLFDNYLRGLQKI